MVQAGDARVVVAFAGGAMDTAAIASATTAAATADATAAAATAVTATAAAIIAVGPELVGPELKEFNTLVAEQETATLISTHASTGAHHLTLDITGFDAACLVDPTATTRLVVTAGSHHVRHGIFGCVDAAHAVVGRTGLMTAAT